MTFTPHSRRRRFTALKVGGIALGGFVVFVIWAIFVIAGLAVPALAVWALLHFALGWV